MFAVIGKITGGRSLMPAVIDSIPCGRGSVVAGHQVTVSYHPGKRAGPRSGRYVITIAGQRMDACWMFRPRELETLSRMISHALRRPDPQREGQFGTGVEVW